ncbi:hypothetical protein RDB90_004333 [Salmonella enterica]|nr:hypothetical protein [Salmonella enterica subsp. diarizonae]ELE1935772.1 hypothetical protein [Salmonella enterica]
MIDANLINLPWATLVTLASGYIGYFIANVGLKDHHKTVDITFATLVFSLLPTLGYTLISMICTGFFTTYASTTSAVVIAVVTGALWRICGRKWMYGILRALNISWSDNTNSAWQQMFGLTDYRCTELFVILKDGSGLQSRPLSRFEGLPNGPFTLGNSGDVILYVTHTSEPDSDDWIEFEEVIHKSWGALATYIPADQIAKVEIRRNPVKPLPDAGMR